jgi:hypothetical protein
MEAMGDQLAEYGGSTAMLMRPGSRAGVSSNAVPDGGARLVYHAAERSVKMSYPIGRVDL